MKIKINNKKKFPFHNKLALLVNTATQVHAHSKKKVCLQTKLYRVCLPTERAYAAQQKARSHRLTREKRATRVFREQQQRRA